MSGDPVVPPAQRPAFVVASREHAPHRMRARRIGLSTSQHQPTAYMRSDCDVCRSEGFAARSEILVASGHGEIVAGIVHCSPELLHGDEIGLCEKAWASLRVEPGELVAVGHAPTVASLGELRRRVYGNRLSQGSFQAIITDIVAGRYNDVHLASFVTACSAFPLDLDETMGLTRAMVDVGDRLSWGSGIVVDKHSVGGLPGNRTTPIVVAIVAAQGLLMPKTSSRAITSPAGTADTMETLAPVDLNLAAIRRVVEQEGGCIVWGGSVRLSPADDFIIGVERVLDLDAVGQMVASVLSKKIAAGSTHLVIDMPIGPSAKVRSEAAGIVLSDALLAVARGFGLETRIMPGPGLEPVGRGIGPALEARDVLAVLRNNPGLEDLRSRAIELAGAILELGGRTPPGSGAELAAQTLASGSAWEKFQRICEAQGGMREPPCAAHRHTLTAARPGRITGIDNRKLAKLAKLAGAPAAKAAGLEMHVRLGDAVEIGMELCTVHAETHGELHYALAYAAADGAIFSVAE